MSKPTSLASQVAQLEIERECFLLDRNALAAQLVEARKLITEMAPLVSEFRELYQRAISFPRTLESQSRESVEPVKTK